MIRNLVFDVGGVLLEYRWQDMFRQQGLSEEEIGDLAAGGGSEGKGLPYLSFV